MKAIKNAPPFWCFYGIFLYFGGFFVLEPFGLFNLLKTILSFQQTEETERQEKAEETPPPPQVETPTETQKENAYLRFLEAHEKRKRGK